MLACFTLRVFGKYFSNLSFLSYDRMRTPTYVICSRSQIPIRPLSLVRYFGNVAKLVAAKNSSRGEVNINNTVSLKDVLADYVSKKNSIISNGKIITKTVRKSKTDPTLKEIKVVIADGNEYSLTMIITIYMVITLLNVLLLIKGPDQKIHKESGLVDRLQSFCKNLINAIVNFKITQKIINELLMRTLKGDTNKSKWSETTGLPTLIPFTENSKKILILSIFKKIGRGIPITFSVTFISYAFCSLIGERMDAIRDLFDSLQNLELESFEKEILGVLPGANEIESEYQDLVKNSKIQKSSSRRRSQNRNSQGVFLAQVYSDKEWQQASEWYEQFRNSPSYHNGGREFLLNLVLLEFQS